MLWYSLLGICKVWGLVDAVQEEDELLHVGLKYKSAAILYFSCCQEIQQKDQNQEYISTSLNNFWLSTLSRAFVSLLKAEILERNIYHKVLF